MIFSARHQAFGLSSFKCAKNYRAAESLDSAYL